MGGVSKSWSALQLPGSDSYNRNRNAAGMIRPTKKFYFRPPFELRQSSYGAGKRWHAACNSYGATQSITRHGSELWRLMVPPA